LPDFASVYEKVVPGVVVVRVYRTAQSRGVPDGLGSGFFAGSEGRILTNEHVIAGGGRIEIETFDGRTAEATLVGSDPAMDLAVLEVALDPMVAGLPVAGEDSVTPGSWVMAVGNPLGLEFSATRGVISSVERGGGVWNRLGPWDFLQTDAAINRGNSGGPLVDLDGRVVGICTAMDGEADRISFAIPMPLAVRVQEHLERYGEVRRGWLGIELEREQGGIVVKGVVPDSPAERAGVRPGDRVVAVDGRWAGTDLGRVRFELSVSEANRPVVLVLDRQGRRIELEVDLEPLPEGSVTRGGLT
jgi:S1-C subfamily serine protease